MNVVDLSDLERLDRLSRITFGLLILGALMRGGRGVRCRVRDGRLDFLGPGDNDVLCSTEMPGMADEVLSELRVLGLPNADPAASPVFRVKIRDLETTVTLDPPDPTRADAFELRFDASTAMGDTARSVFEAYGRRPYQGVVLRDGKIVGRTGDPRRATRRRRIAVVSVVLCVVLFIMIYQFH